LISKTLINTENVLSKIKISIEKLEPHHFGGAGAATIYSSGYVDS
jgi:hypothetical protein